MMLMRTFLAFLVFAASLAAEIRSLPLSTDLVQGPITINCSYVDFSSWGGVFASAPTQFRCLISSESPDTRGVVVTIRTRDAEGNLHIQTNTSEWALAAPSNAKIFAYTIIAFPTKDRTLLSVDVSEYKVPTSFTAE